jgi:PAS domain S-box-containing protein
MKAEKKALQAPCAKEDCRAYMNVVEELSEFKRLTKKLDTVLESSYDGIFITDGNAITTRVNKAYERITGIRADEILGKHVDVLVEQGIISKACSTVVLRTRDVVTLHQKLSSGKILLVTGTPIFDDHGEIEMIVTNVRDITELQKLRDELYERDRKMDMYNTKLESLRKTLNEKSSIYSKDGKMVRLLDAAERVASHDTTVLITGETGVGKERMAEFIHQNSLRADKKLISVNCGAIPDSLIESALFGYVAGAFTGAKANGKVGLFEEANGGTIFLDEIGELPYNVQVKLLRVLQEQEVQRVGSVDTTKINVRIIAATNKDLKAMSEEGTFRKDLFYRLNIIPIHIPPLRERKADIIPLINAFLKEMNLAHDMEKRLSKDAYEKLYRYSWPGNIRELKNVMERVFVMCQDNTILSNELPVELENYIDMSSAVPKGNLKQAVANLESKMLAQAYEEYGNVRDAAKALGIDASTFVRKRSKYEKIVKDVTK